MGGGAAGTAAALCAAAGGGRVTLVEKSSSPSRGSAPDAAVGAPPLFGAGRALESAGVEVLRGSPAVSVSSALRVASSRWSARFDAVVVATGSRRLRAPLCGSRKEGVFAFDGPCDQAPMRAGLASARAIVVAGAGLDALQVADTVARSGASVTIISRRDACFRALGCGLGEVLAQAARAAGVTLAEGPLEKALGLGALEGVVAGGRVIPCDGLAMVPPAVPAVPAVDAALGPLGGVAVGPSLESTSRGIFAAGGCAETGAAPGEDGWEGSAGPMGRVAGANASGGCFRYVPFRSLSGTIFGVAFGCAGMTPSEARLAGYDPAVASKRWGPFEGCWVVYDRRGGMALGVQAAGEAAVRCLQGARLAVSQGVLLRTLTGPGGLGSIDITPILEAVREGLTHRG